jgi:transposase
MPHVPFPVVEESAEELLGLRRAERDERRRERLHALWLVASGAVGSRLALARAAGRNRETVSRWLSDYAQGGLEALLRAAGRPGPPSQGGISLPAEVQEAIRVRLAQPQGERGYLALWRWARAEHAVKVGYAHFHRWVHDRLGATLKVARKSHGQKKTGNSKPTASRA